MTTGTRILRISRKFIVFALDYAVVFLFLFLFSLAPLSQLSSLCLCFLCLVFFFFFSCASQLVI